MNIKLNFHALLLINNFFNLKFQVGILCICLYIISSFGGFSFLNEEWKPKSPFPLLLLSTIIGSSLLDFLKLECLACLVTLLPLVWEVPSWAQVKCGHFSSQKSCLPSQNQLPRRVTGAFQSGALSWWKRKSEWGWEEPAAGTEEEERQGAPSAQGEVKVWIPDDWKQKTPRPPEES